MPATPPSIQPRVSIGMPVYNGEEFIREALDSLLTQTFVDFELIISDNASTDSTSDICEEYAEKDSRIRYFRQPRNMGAFLNFKFVLEQAQGEFFKWCAADDYIGSADYLSELVAALEHGSECAFSNTDVLESNGQRQIMMKKDTMSVFNSCHDALSFSKAALKIASMQLYGLFNRAALINCFPYLEACSDLTVFGEGLFVHAISEKLKLTYVHNIIFVFRRHDNNVSSTQPANKLLLDFMKYTMRLFRYYIFYSKYQSSTRLYFLMRISIVHSKVGLRLLGSTIKQLGLNLVRYPICFWGDRESIARGFEER